MRTMKRRQSVSGKTVLITGAARGIGAETARRLHAKGANVSLVGIEPDRLAALANELGDRVDYFHTDVTDVDALNEATAGTVYRFGGIDAVIANAGIAPPTQTVADIASADFERTLTINLNGVWRTVKATLPHILDSRGHIVLVSSIYSFLNGALNASYAMSKAGVEQLGRALRVELAPSGASAGVAYFGFIDTDMAHNAFAQPAATALRKALPAFITATTTVEHAADKLVENVERRSSRVTTPRWVAPALMARGPMGLIDDRLANSGRLHAAIRVAEQQARSESA
jgi:NAD(P)-dependent dehydrogenase (short-subunit alcohol dehydrogenase family)